MDIGSHLYLLFMKASNMFIYGYTRDSQGIVVNYHRVPVANTIHGRTGKGGNTDQFPAMVYETE